MLQKDQRCLTLKLSFIFSHIRETPDARKPRFGVLDFQEETFGPEPTVLPLWAIGSSVFGVDQGGGRHLPLHPHQRGQQQGGDLGVTWGTQQL